MKKSLNLLTLVLLIPSIWLSYLYYSHKEFTFNAEFIVFICFVIFVALAWKTITKLISSSMSERATEIETEYNELKSETVSSYSTLINSLNKYNSLNKIISDLFYFAFEKSYNTYNTKTVVDIDEFYEFIKKELNFLVLLNSIYLNYLKYYFIKLFSHQLELAYSNNNQLLEYLNNIKYIISIKKQIFKKNNKFFTNI